MDSDHENQSEFGAAQNLDETRDQNSSFSPHTPSGDPGKASSPLQGSHSSKSGTIESPFFENDLIGRYVVIREIGKGGFGFVYLARDPTLDRKVAIKYPRLHRARVRKEVFLEEGRAVAKLNHESIVKIYNIEETEQGDPYVVMEYVKGPTLRSIIAEEGLTLTTSLQYLIQIGEALSYAHSKTLIHRDLKPANVIITGGGKMVKLMDFGLALHDMTPEDRLPTTPEGTPPYMSPEQIRCENHRLDGRTDIWAFGVIMYLMLTGRRPFLCKRMSELAEEICLHDPKLPRAINASIPPELERICLKCLEKLMSSRYQSAQELLEDLKGFQEQWVRELTGDPTMDSVVFSPGAISGEGRSKSGLSQSGSQTRKSLTETRYAETHSVRVVPKGLRSFDEQDAEFFVDLLPGPKDRHNVPESLRFWTNKIRRGADEPVSVGLIYGPSGCGKSSFVKAGLIPHLEGIRIAYIEASPSDTENRILQKLARIAPHAANEHDDLPRVFARIRRGQSLTGEKTLIVIDQFEQWLHSHPDLANQLLVDALRHCDGNSLACLMLVRDDFWMSATQFMAQLDLKVQDGVNALGIPLFDRKHARRVLTAYGIANEAFDGEITPKQKIFVASAVDEISDHGRVIPIHLAPFSQMMDSDSWDEEQLKKMGGWKGLGVHFLNSIFAEKRAAGFEDRSRRVLQRLLPARGEKIKGAKRSFEDLLQATGDRSTEKLRDCLDFLDRELRIITPTESDGDSEQQNYQLTHDYLVEPIRQWLTQKEQQTRQGRARIQLEELSTQWESNHDPRFLPGPLEFAIIRSSVRKSACTNLQRAYLNRAARFYAIRFGAAALILAMIGLIAFRSYDAMQQNLAAEKIASLLICSPEEVDARMQLLNPFKRSEVIQIAKSKQESLTDARSRLHGLYVQSRFGQPAEIPLEAMLAMIPEAEAAECRNLVDALQPLASSTDSAKVFDALKTQFLNSESDSVKFRIAVVALQLGNSALAEELLEYQPDPEVRQQFIEQFPNWHGSLEDLIEVVSATRIPSFQSGMCLALGQLPAAEFEAGLNPLKAMLGQLVKDADSPGVHSSARWALEQLGEIPVIDQLQADDSSWFVEQFAPDEQMTFIRVEPQLVYKGYGLDKRFERMFRSTPEEVLLDHEFYISAREVSARLFFQFVASLDPADPIRIKFDDSDWPDRLDQNLPIAGVNWDEAARFCNWLSEIEGRKPCYSKTDIEMNTLTEGEIPYAWDYDDTANGFRLPRAFEWEAAARCGTKTTYLFGNQLSRLHRFAVTPMDPTLDRELKVAPRGRKMPSRLGLFDLNGNAQEWCHDEPWMDQPTDRLMRGGHSMSDVRNFQVSAGFMAPIYKASDWIVGIRLVVERDK